MNGNELRAEMARHGDSGTKLAELMGIKQNTFSYKINGKFEGFTQNEIQFLIDRYNLSSEAIWRIFFAPDASRTDENTQNAEEKVTMQT